MRAAERNNYKRGWFRRRARAPGLGPDQPVCSFSLHEARVLASAKANEAPGFYSARPPLEIKSLGR
jgi:hypothetical protein